MIYILIFWLIYWINIISVLMNYVLIIYNLMLNVIKINVKIKDDNLI